MFYDNQVVIFIENNPTFHERTDDSRPQGHWKHTIKSQNNYQTHQFYQIITNWGV